MARKKTAAELYAEAQKAEKRAKELKARAVKVTQAEQAKANAEIIKAVRVWHESFPIDKRTAWEDMPAIFYKWAEKNREKYSE